MGCGHSSAAEEQRNVLPVTYSGWSNCSFTMAISISWLVRVALVYHTLLDTRTGLSPLQMGGRERERRRKRERERERWCWQDMPFFFEG
jgi:hypothetical protein